MGCFHGKKENNNLGEGHELFRGEQSAAGAEGASGGGGDGNLFSEQPN